LNAIISEKTDSNLRIMFIAYESLLDFTPVLWAAPKPPKPFQLFLSIGRNELNLFYWFVDSICEENTKWIL